MHCVLADRHHRVADRSRPDLHGCCCGKSVSYIPDDTSASAVTQWGVPSPPRVS